MEQKRLSRKWLRISLTLIYAILAIYVLMGIFAFLRILREVVSALLVVTVILMAADIAIQYLFLRCTTCGKNLARGSWNPGKTFYCPYCGRPFLFDDDPPDETETTTREEP